MKTKILIILIIFLFCSALFSFAQDGSQWPNFQGNSARTGFSPSSAPSNPEALWQLTVGEFRKLGIDPRGINRPIIYNNKVFFGSTEVLSLDLSNGKILWHYKDKATDFYVGGVAAGDGKIFAVVGDTTLIKSLTKGFIYALSEQSGQFLWKYQTQKPITHSMPLFIEGKVFIGDDSGTLYAIDAKTGSLIWKKFLDAEVIHSSPAFYNGTIFIGTEGTGRSNELPSYVYALNAADGLVLWRFQVDYIPGKVCLVHATPAVLDDVVYIGGENGYFYALSSRDGKLIWKKKIASGSERVVGVSAPAALGYGKIFIRTWEGKFLALNQEDGTVLWEHSEEGGADISAIVADRKVFLGHKCFNESTGKIIWKQNFIGRIPVLASGILVIPNAEIADGSSDSTPILTAFFEEEKVQPSREPVEGKEELGEEALVPESEKESLKKELEEVVGVEERLGEEKRNETINEEESEKMNWTIISTIVVGVCILIFIGYLLFRLSKKKGRR